MPIKKAAMKAMRQTKKRTLRNALVKDNIAYLRRMLRKAMEAKEVAKATDLTKQIIRAVDRGVQKKVLKLNTGSRIKSRMMANLKKLGK